MFIQINTARLPSELVQHYASRNKTVTRAEARVARGLVCYRITSDSGVMVEWTRQDSVSVPWRNRLVK